MLERRALLLPVLFLCACGEGAAPAAASSGTPAPPPVETARIEAVCGLIRARETAYRASLDPGPPADPEPEEIRGSLWGDEDSRSLPSVLESIDRQMGILEGRPRNAPVRDRCEADLGRHALASRSGFACVEGCAQKDGYRRLSVCVDRCIRSDADLLAARRAVRRSAEQRAGVRETLLTGPLSKTTRTRVGAFSILVPEGAKTGRDGFLVERPELPPVLSVTLRAVEHPQSTLSAEATWGEKGTGLVMFRESSAPTSYTLARIGSRWDLAARPLEPSTRDYLRVQTVRDGVPGSPRFVCDVGASLLDMDDTVTEAIVAWAQRICGSVVYEGP